MKARNPFGKPFDKRLPEGPARSQMVELLGAVETAHRYDPVDNLACAINSISTVTSAR
jgi:hypothetical protein